MMDILKERVKHYDRSIVLVGTAISVLAAIYFGTQNSINRLIETSEVVQSLKLINAQQAILNSKFNEELGDLKAGQKSVADDVTKILFEIKKVSK